MTRPKYPTRAVLLTETTVGSALIAARNAPRDGSVEMVLREPVKARGLDANGLMWAGPLKDIAKQACWEGQFYTDVVWHDTFKRLYLPEEFDPELCLEKYQKWAVNRNGDKILIGSTTDLTKKGFSLYLEQVYADGANMGVLFSANPRAA